MAIGATAAFVLATENSLPFSSYFHCRQRRNEPHLRQKGTDLPSSSIWAGVSGGVAIIFALSWPGMINSMEAKRWSAALMVSPE